VREEDRRNKEKMEENIDIGLLMKIAVNCIPSVFMMGLQGYLNRKIDTVMAIKRVVTRNPTHSGAILYANTYLFFELEESLKEDLKRK